MDEGSQSANLVARAAALHERLRFEEDEADLAGHYSTGMHEAFDDAGFYRILLPARYAVSSWGSSPSIR